MDVAAKSSYGAKKLAPKKRVPGIDKGRIWIAEDFDVFTESELADWYGVAEVRLEKRLPSPPARNGGSQRRIL